MVESVSKVMWYNSGPTAGERGKSIRTKDGRVKDDSTIGGCGSGSGVGRLLLQLSQMFDSV